MASPRFHTLTLPLLFLAAIHTPALSFLPKANLGWTQAKRSLHPPLVVLYSSTARRRSSRVIDEDGPTPDPPYDDVEEVDPDDIPELREIVDAEEMPPGPIPHQPWRRGDTAGCEDPITADWRIRAEEIMTKAADFAGGKVIDITWFLTSVLVTLDEDMSGAQDLLKSKGPVITVQRPQDPIYYDPMEPKKEEMWVDEDEIVYQSDTEEEIEDRKEKKRQMYAKKDENDDPDEPHIPEEDDDTDEYFVWEETRADRAEEELLEEIERHEEEEIRVKSAEAMNIDTAALSTIAGAMMEALEDYESELHILSRHELVLSSPGPPDVLETQKQFDAHRGELVIVETQDPWNSNRVLKGKLLDRNSMDVYINKKGRMVTIPLNFVKCVRIQLPEGEEEVDPEEMEIEK